MNEASLFALLACFCIFIDIVLYLLRPVLAGNLDRYVLAAIAMLLGASAGFMFYFIVAIAAGRLL